MDDIEVHDLFARDYYKIKKYFDMRDPGICDSMFIDNYIWRNYYDSKYFTTDKGLFWIYQLRGEYFTILPLCKPEDLPECFDFAVRYFNEVLGVKFKIYIADEEGVNQLNLPSDRFKVEEERDYFDYVYAGEALRTLRGKKLRKKKNHLNSFLNTYEGRYEYRHVCCEDRDAIVNFLNRWYDKKESDDIYNRLAAEYQGIMEVLEHCRELEYRMAAVYVDGVMEAFTLGSYSRTNDMVFIHVEKANPAIRGLYNYINKTFLEKEYPNVEFVNREDDMGLEGLRKAKMSYRPLYLAKKYSITQR